MKTDYKLTLTSAAVVFGVSRETVRRALAGTGVKHEPDAKFTIKQVHLALTGDVKFERARLLRAQADAAERENRKAKGELVNVDEALQRAKEQFIIPFRTRLFDLARKKGFEPELKQLMAEFQETRD